MEEGSFIIDVTAKADPDARDAILSGLLGFNEEQAGPVRLLPLNVLLRDNEGKAVGGLWGETYFSWLFVGLFYIPPALRLRGLGSRLLNAAEAEARKRGCIGAWLDTFAFQAPGFYERLGYERFARLDDFPPGHSRIFFTKTL